MKRFVLCVGCASVAVVVCGGELGWVLEKGSGWRWWVLLGGFFRDLAKGYMDRGVVGHVTSLVVVSCWSCMLAVGGTCTAVALAC